MNFLPIVRLELRAAARKRMTYYSRSLTALVAVSAGIGFVVAGFTGITSAAAAGQAVFCLLAGGAYALLATLAILLTCDCVSREKREATLGLLFLSNLNGFDIVAGKLTAHASRSFYCLLAAFPAFGVCLLLGGVSLAEFAEVTLGLLNTLFYFATLGILISACVWQERQAAVWGGLALLLLGVTLPALCVVINQQAWLAVVPAGAMLAALGPVIGMTAPPGMAASLLVSNALGWLFVGAACCLVPRTWTRAASASPSRAAAAARRAKSSPATSTDGLIRSGNPLLTTAVLAMICAVALLVKPFGLPAPTVITRAKITTALLTILLLHGILKFQAATQAGRVFAGKRRSGELELLLTTPLDEDAILRGSLLGLKRSLFLPTLFALGVDAAILIYGWWQAGFQDGLGWAAVITVEVIWMLANLYALSWVGLFLGLRLADPIKAARQAIFYVVLAPWVALIFFGLLAALLVRGYHFGTDLIAPAALIFAIALAFCNSFFTGWAMNELRDQFRPLAAS